MRSTKTSTPGVYQAFGNCYLNEGKTLEAVGNFYLHFGNNTVVETLFAVQRIYSHFQETGEEIPKETEFLLSAISEFARDLNEAAVNPNGAAKA